MDKANIKALTELFALDLGTTKFCMGALQETADPSKKGQFSISSASVPAGGMRRGMLANMGEAREALNDLIEIAETQFKADISEVVVGVAGSHLSSRTISVGQAIETTVVTEEDVASLLAKAEQQEVHETREVLHIVPIGYRLDDREAIDEPIGFSGNKIEADFFVIDADKHYLKDLIELCNECGLQVRRLYSEPFASASVTVPDEHKQLGCAMADIGGGTTDGLVFQNGKPQHAFTINIGGKLMTNDLAVGLNLGALEAEKLKIRFGLMPRMAEDSVECQDVSGQIKLYRPAHTIPILGARLQELGSHLALNLKAFRGGLGGGLVLTGGGCEVRGMQEFYHKKMGIPVHRSKPTVAGHYNFIITADQLSGANITHPTRHATMLGLLNLEIGNLQEQMAKRSASWSSRYLGQFVNWLKELS